MLITADGRDSLVQVQEESCLPSSFALNGAHLLLSNAGMAL